jgi:hypothetical protein
MTAFAPRAQSQLHFKAKQSSHVQKEVPFYATDASTATKLRPELQSFSKILPPRVKLAIYNPAANASR